MSNGRRIASNGSRIVVVTTPYSIRDQPATFQNLVVGAVDWRMLLIPQSTSRSPNACANGYWTSGAVWRHSPTVIPVSLTWRAVITQPALGIPPSVGNWICLSTQYVIDLRRDVCSDHPCALNWRSHSDNFSYSFLYSYHKSNHNTAT